MVKRDTDHYDLRVQTAQGSAVIDTTRKHLFWDLTQDKWVRAGKLKHGDTLRASNGATVAVAGGDAPKQRTGWMWDISVPEATTTTSTSTSPAQPSSSTTARLQTRRQRTRRIESDIDLQNQSSMGQRIFTNGRTFITQDVTSHTGGLWEMARTIADLASKSTRMGTYDYDLNYLGP